MVSEKDMLIFRSLLFFPSGDGQVQIVVRFRKIPINPQRFSELMDCRIKLTLCHQHKTQIVTGMFIMGIYPER